MGRSKMMYLLQTGRKTAFFNAYTLLDYSREWYRKRVWSSRLKSRVVPRGLSKVGSFWSFFSPSLALLPLETIVKNHLLVEIYCTVAKLQGQLKAILPLCTSPNSNLQRPRDVSDAKMVSLMRHLSLWYIMELIEDQPFILYDMSAALWFLQTFDYVPQIINREW